jgi:hypothetical protein
VNGNRRNYRAATHAEDWTERFRLSKSI